MEKYYTPVLDDIMVNMPVQILEQNTTKMIRQVEWHDVMVTPNDNLIGKKIAFNRMARLLKSNKVRVKYLDLDDIESCGFKYLGSGWYELINVPGSLEYWVYVRLRIWEPKSFIIGYRGNPNEYPECEQEFLFQGSIRNISELKELMNKVGINEP